MAEIPRHYSKDLFPGSICPHYWLGLYEGLWISQGFSPNYPVELEESFYSVVETYVIDGGDCSVRLEENLVVTKDGYQVFSLVPFEEEAVGFIED